MSRRTTPPFRADHVGSLLRPAPLLEARAAHARGELDDDALRAEEDVAIADVVALQRDVGLQTATDGEFRRTSWHMDFIYAIDGISRTDEQIDVAFRNDAGDMSFTSAALRVDGKVGIGKPVFADAFSYLQSVVTSEQTPKLTIPSPSMVHYRGGPAALDPAVYPDEEEFWRTSRGPTPTRSGASPHRAAPTCNSTTPASPTSTTRPSASR